MRKRIVLLLLPMVLGSPLLAQAPDTVWTKTYGTGGLEEGGYWVGETSDSGYLILATTPSFGAGFYDVWLIRTDLAGDTVWTKTYGGTQNDICRGMEQTSDGGYIMAGYTASYGAGSSDVWLLKLDADGDTTWTRTYGGPSWDGASAVRQTLDGGYIIVGTTVSFGSGANDAWLLKTDTQGDTLWTRTYGGVDGDDAWSVRQTSDRGYIIAGTTTSSGPFNYDVWLVKTDSIGDTLWTKTYGGSGWNEGHDVLQTPDNGYVVIGLRDSLGIDLNVWLLRTDSIGSTVWARSYGGTSGDGPNAITQTSDSTYLIAGWTYSCGGNLEAYLIKTDTLGDTLWTAHYGGAEDDEAYFITPTSDGGYLMVGETTSFGAGFEDVWIVKLEAETGVEEETIVTPLSRFVMISPNPFRREVRIEWQMPVRSEVDVAICDIAGRKVRNLSVPEGSHERRTVRWDGRDDLGREVPAGIYFCRLAGDDLQATEKVILLR